MNIVITLDNLPDVFYQVGLDLDSVWYEAVYEVGRHIVQQYRHDPAMIGTLFTKLYELHDLYEEELKEEDV